MSFIGNFPNDSNEINDSVTTIKRDDYRSNLGIIKIEARPSEISSAQSPQEAAREQQETDSLIVDLKRDISSSVPVSCLESSAYVPKTISKYVAPEEDPHMRAWRYLLKHNLLHILQVLIPGLVQPSKDK